VELFMLQRSHWRHLLEQNGAVNQTYIWDSVQSCELCMVCKRL
ncbi:hypothetical protein LSAT2_017110, partial [Lamellibrachia satsuma]